MQEQQLSTLSGAGANFAISRTNHAIMENLQQHTIELTHKGQRYTFTIVERDYGEGMAYDVFLDNDYILTFSGHGEVLFNNLDKINRPKEKIDLELFQQLVEEMRKSIMANLNRP